MSTWIAQHQAAQAKRHLDACLVDPSTSILELMSSTRPAPFKQCVRPRVSNALLTFEAIPLLDGHPEPDLLVWLGIWHCHVLELQALELVPRCAASFFQGSDHEVHEPARGVT